MSARVCIAQIGAAHGVRGEVRLKPFTANPLAVTRYGALESEDGKRRFEIETVRPAKDMLVARLKDVTDRDTAEAPYRRDTRASWRPRTRQRSHCR